MCSKTAADRHIAVPFDCFIRLRRPAFRWRVTAGCLTMVTGHYHISQRDATRAASSILASPEGSLLGNSEHQLQIETNFRSRSCFWCMPLSKSCWLVNGVPVTITVFSYLPLSTATSSTELVAKYGWHNLKNQPELEQEAQACPKIGRCCRTAFLFTLQSLGRLTRSLGRRQCRKQVPQATVDEKVLGEL